MTCKDNRKSYIQNIIMMKMLTGLIGMFLQIINALPMEV